jgi:hypothetical protein
MTRGRRGREGAGGGALALGRGEDSAKESAEGGREARVGGAGGYRERMAGWLAGWLEEGLMRAGPPGEIVCGPSGYHDGAP